MGFSHHDVSTMLGKNYEPGMQSFTYVDLGHQSSSAIKETFTFSF